ncbi:MAG: glycine cleavage system protein GcvH [Thermodesulfobacteriota bacterium]
MNFPNDLLYTKEHEWIKMEDGVVAVGITDYAQDKLGDVVYVELPDVGSQVARGDTFGVVESVKTVSDLYVPISGKVIEINETLADKPELINQDPYGEGWLLKIEIESKKELNHLISARDYEEFVTESEE